MQRAFSLVLLAGLGVWLVAPATGAVRPLPVALDAPPTVEAAFEQALAAAGEAATPEAFVTAFTAALGADPDLARFLEQQGLDGGGGTEALLAVLYGHLLRSFGHERGLTAAPAPPVAAPSGAVPGFAADAPRTDADVLVRSAPAQAPALRRIVVPLAVLSSAQPLGP